MASLSKTKTLFGFTSPRTVEKIIPEIRILCGNFAGETWSGNQDVQTLFFNKLFESKYYLGDTYPSDPALAARDRITRAPKAFGFVDLKPKLALTKVGEYLLSEKRSDEIFTKQMLKFQLPSPFHTQSKSVEFCVRPYLELIRLINDLGSISKTEMAIFFTQLINIEEYDLIVSKIRDFRNGARAYKGSRKMYVAEVFEREIRQIYYEEIQNDKTSTRESMDASLSKFIKTKRANMKDYADAYVRYIRATELVTFEKRTYRLIISPQKIDEVQYILATIPREPIEFSTQKEFKSYLFDPFSLKLLGDDKDLLLKKIQKLGAIGVDETDHIDEIKDIYDELKTGVKARNLTERKQELKEYKEYDDIVEVFAQIKNKDVPDPPLFLEWNVWRSFEMLNYAKRINGNFVIDMDGMPLNTAPGNMADMEIEFEDFGIIGEVTLSSGATQFKMEGDSVPRHYGDFKERINKEAYCIFIAPRIHEGTKAFFFNLNKGYTDLYGGATKIIPMSLEQFEVFVDFGVSSKFSEPEKLKSWLDSLIESNHISDDEVAWNESIENSIEGWAA